MTADEIKNIAMCGETSSNIEFRNEASDDQFRAILWRAEQKTTRKTVGSEKTTRKIIELIKANPKVSREDLALACGVSSDAIKLQIRKLRESGKIRRVGPDKGGHWEVL